MIVDEIKRCNSLLGKQQRLGTARGLSGMMMAGILGEGFQIIQDQ